MILSIIKENKLKATYMQEFSFVTRGGYGLALAGDSELGRISVKEVQRWSWL